MCCAENLSRQMYQFWIIDNSRVKKTPLPNSIFIVQQVECPISHQAPTILLYIYNASILVIAALYAWRTRNVISSKVIRELRECETLVAVTNIRLSLAFNENNFTVAAITLITVITIVIVPVIQSKLLLCFLSCQNARRTEGKNRFPISDVLTLLCSDKLS